MQPILDGIGISTEDPNDAGVLRDFHYNADDDVNLQVRIVALTQSDVGPYSIPNTAPVGLPTALLRWSGLSAKSNHVLQSALPLLGQYIF
ncbi:MAG: hypothetical protein MP439_05555 [Ferrimicrobium sp.]|nr:hypothetical protein [Ferrimicrobium sp.]